MKLSPWWIGGGVGLVVLGLVALTFGLLQPGWPEPVETPAGGGKSPLAETKQKASEFHAKIGELEQKKKGLKDTLEKPCVFAQGD